MNAGERLSFRELSMLIALLGIAGFFTIYGHATTGRLDYISPRNLSLMAIELAITATLALGMLLVILPGHIDLAAGSSVGLFGGVAAMLVMNPSGLVMNLLGRPCGEMTGQGLPAAAGMAIAAAAAVLLYGAIGWLVAYQRIPAFIITLGGLMAFKGLHWKVINNQTIPVAPGGQSNVFSDLTTCYFPAWAAWALAGVVIALLALAAVRRFIRRRRAGLPGDGEILFLKVFVAAQIIALAVAVTNLYRGLPLSLAILAAIAFAVHMLTQNMRFGRYLYAAGGNEEAARLSGVPVERITIQAYMLMGFIAALAGFLQTAYGGSSTATVGQLMELDAVAACVIGGASLKGGRGSVTGVLFGAMLMAAMINGMTLNAFAPETRYIARGVVLALAVWLDVALNRRRAA